jgi:hypothetical protein
MFITESIGNRDESNLKLPNNFSGGLIYAF